MAIFFPGSLPAAGSNPIVEMKQPDARLVPVQRFLSPNSWTGSGSGRFIPRWTPRFVGRAAFHRQCAGAGNARQAIAVTSAFQGIVLWVDRSIYISYYRDPGCRILVEVDLRQVPRRGLFGLHRR